MRPWESCFCLLLITIHGSHFTLWRTQLFAKVKWQARHGEMLDFQVLSQVKPRIAPPQLPVPVAHSWTLLPPSGDRASRHPVRNGCWEGSQPSYGVSPKTLPEVTANSDPVLSFSAGALSLLICDLRAMTSPTPGLQGVIPESVPGYSACSTSSQNETDARIWARRA